MTCIFSGKALDLPENDGLPYRCICYNHYLQQEILVRYYCTNYI